MQQKRSTIRLIACPHVLSTEQGWIDFSGPPAGALKIYASIAWVPEGLDAGCLLMVSM